MARSGRSPFDNNPLRRRLAALRRRLCLVVTVRGVGWLLALVLLTTVAVGALDWAWHLPALVRGFCLVGLLCAAGLVALLFLLRPLLDRMDDLTLALRIEERYPSLNDSLASTIQFLEQAEKKALGEETGPAVKDSLAMRREAARRAMQKAAGCDFDRIIDTRGLRSAAVLGGLALILSGALAGLFPTQASIAVSRLTNPFRASAWPSATTIELEPYRTRIGRNDAFELRGRIRGVIPEKAQVVYRQENASAETHTIQLSSEKPGEARLLALLRPGQNTTSFTFQVKANDASTEWLRVEVAPAPSLTALQVHLFYPEYTGLSWQKLPPGNGNINAIAGTSATLKASASTTLRAAWLEYHPGLPGHGLSAFLAPLAARDSASLVGMKAVSQEIAGRHPATLSADRKSFHLRFFPQVNGNYSIHLEDDTGLTSQRTCELILQSDPPPVVVLKRPNTLYEPAGVFPLRVDVQDVQFGIRSVWLEYRLNGEGPFFRLPLFDPPQGAANRAATIASPVLPALAVRQRPTEHLIEAQLPVSQFRHPDGSPPHEGDAITLRARADDHDTVTPGKQPGSSDELELRIVTRTGLELAMSGDQARIQRELQEQRQAQREAIRQTTEIENRAARLGKLSLDDRAELSRLEKAQEKIREKLETGPESIRGQIERVLETLKQNGLTRSAVQDRMEGIQKELDRLGREELRQIEAALTDARNQAESTNAQNNPALRALEQVAERAERRVKPLEQLAPEQARPLREQASRLRQLLEEAGKEQPEARIQERSRELERLAQERGKLAQELEKRAREDAGKAAELLNQASEQKEAARELQELARAQQEPQKRERTDPRASLTDARRRQEEVDKTLGELLQRLEPWSSTREVKGEARALAEEQRRLLEEVEAMQPQLAGKERNELKGEQAARLDNAIAAQQKLRERIQQLLDRMRRLSDEKNSGDPETAQEMKQALEQAQQGDIPAQMKMARERLEANQLAEAGKEQQRALGELERLVRKLDDRREAVLRQNNAELEKLERKLEELAEEQDRLQKKVKEAEKIENPGKREQALRELAQEQQQLRERTQAMARRLSQLKAQRASESVNQAARQMEEALRRLARGEKASEPQEEALERLDEAVEDAQKARGNNEEELAREQLARVGDVIKRLKERHDRLLLETGRLQKEAQERKQWERDLILGLGDLAETQKLLGEETRAVAERDLGGAEVFARQLLRAAESMKKSAEALQGHLERARKQPDDLGPPTEAERLQKQAQARLQSLIDALNLDPNESARPNRGAQRGGQGQGQGQSPRPGDGIPPLAQLKLLRGMQAEVAERTRELSARQEKPGQLSDDEKKELQSLQKEQRLIADLIEEFDRPEKDAGEKK